MFFLPIGDDNPHTERPWVNYALIAACVGIYVWQASLGQRGEAAVYVFGLIPGELFGAVQVDPRIGRIPGVLTLFTSMFLHGGVMHLLGNMLYLWIYGDNVEASLGHGRYLLFYVVCGLAAALTQTLAAPDSPVPMIGASGAISGVTGAYLVLHPRANIRVLVWIIIYVSVWHVPAFIVLGLWFAGQLISSAGVDPGQPGVAFMAHIGGFVAGALLVFFFKKRDVPVFDRPHSRAFEHHTRRLRTGRRGAIPDSGRDRAMDGRRDGRRGPWG